MKTRIIALAVTAACASAAVAQSQYEALQFMGNELNGTARFVGMGGAMSSLGADLSTMSTNPAGIGMYRSHDVAVSLDLIIHVPMQICRKYNKRESHPCFVRPNRICVEHQDWK